MEMDIVRLAGGSGVGGKPAGKDGADSVGDNAGSGGNENSIGKIGEFAREISVSTDGNRES